MLQPVQPLTTLPDFNNEVAGLIHGYLFSPDFSARYRPVGMIERMHQQLEQVVRRSSAAVDAIEERLLSQAIKANRSELGRLRRMLLRIQRLLALKRPRE